MKRIKFSVLAFYCVLLVTVVFGSGCAGPKPVEKEKSDRAESPDRSEVPLASEKPGKETFVDEKGKKFEIVSTPSGYVKQRVERAADTEPSGTLPKEGPAVLPKPGHRSVMASAASKSGSTRPVPVSAERQKKKDPLVKKGPKIVLNFDNADLYAVIGTIAELLEISYIVDPNVRGKVTINTAGGLYKKDLFPVFLQILEVNGLTAIKEGSLYRIVQLKDSPRMPIDTRLGLDGKDIPPMDKIIIQIIPLKFISTQEMTKLVTPFISVGGTIVSDTVSNTLLVVDKGINILKILRLVQTFDVNMLEKVSYRFYPVKYLDAEDAANTLNGFTSSYGEASNVFVKFIPITRLNTLFVVSTTPLVFEKIEDILGQIDVLDETVVARIFIYFVKNGAANELATLLNDVLTGKKTNKQEKKKAGGKSSVPENPFSKAKMAEKKAAKAGQTTQKSAASKKIPGKSGEGSSTLMGNVAITPDEIRNALIIESTPSDYKIIQGILKKIDIMPRQVLIQATIAEITLDSSTKFGVEYALGQGAGALGAGFMATVGSGGLKYSIGVTNKWYAELNALATKGRLNVISSPHVLASDNQEAKIDVSREIPLASGQTNVSSGTTISETTIEYRDTGVILSVTPHINERGLVTMDISEEVSNYEGNMAVGRSTSTSTSTSVNEYPVFSKRVIKTTLTVGHGQTIAIGGLIRDREKEELRGLPCLIDMPVIKYLTGSWEKQTEKIELIVLITPRVVDDMDDVEAVTNEFKQKVQSVMKQFYPRQ